MAQFCIVAPHHLCTLLKRDGLLGTAHLLLAHEVVKYPEQYWSLFFRDNMLSINRLVVLDNSVVETGNAVDFAVIKRATQIVRPTCIVLPDVYEDCQATIDSCTAVYSFWVEKLCSSSTSLMMCPQGKTLEEFVRCAEVFTPLAFPTVRWWGVPRNLVDNVGSRCQAIKLLNALAPNRHIHMLGFSDNLIDDILCARMSEVASIDSAVPLRLDGPLLLSEVAPPRPKDWFENAMYTVYVKNNLNYARHLVSGNT